VFPLTVFEHSVKLVNFAHEKDYMCASVSLQQTSRSLVKIMPSEILDTEKFVEISERAEYCIVKRLKDVVKLKLRTAKMLYTLKVEPAKAEEVIKNLRCEIREI
jgi:hypothetical protein